MIIAEPGIGHCIDWARMEAEMFGWREGILLLVGLAAVYLLITIVRLLRVGRHPDQEPLKVAPPDESANPDLPGQFVSESFSVPLNPPRVAGFGEQLAEHLARSDLEREVRQLREEIDALKVELEEMRTQRNISPHYSEALALAQRGLTARDVADRMGISLAEAELVHALSRGESLFDEGENDGADRDEGTLRDPGNAGSGRFEPGFRSESGRGG